MVLLSLWILWAVPQCCHPSGHSLLKIQSRAVSFRIFRASRTTHPTFKPYCSSPCLSWMASSPTQRWNKHSSTGQFLFPKASEVSEALRSLTQSSLLQRMLHHRPEATNKPKVCDLLSELSKHSLGRLEFCQRIICTTRRRE